MLKNIYILTFQKVSSYLLNIIFYSSIKPHRMKKQKFENLNLPGIATLSKQQMLKVKGGGAYVPCPAGTTNGPAWNYCWCNSPNYNTNPATCNSW